MNDKTKPEAQGVAYFVADAYGGYWQTTVDGKPYNFRVPMMTPALSTPASHDAQQPAVVGDGVHLDSLVRVGNVLEKLRRLAIVIRTYGVCAPLALDHIADELEQALTALTPAATQGDDLYRDDWISQAEMDQRLEHLAEEYEWRGDDGDYTPSERERLLLIDFCHGILADEVFVAMMKAHHDPNAKGRPAAQKEGNGNG